jgi:hypothetical protein
MARLPPHAQVAFVDLKQIGFNLFVDLKQIGFNLLKRFKFVKFVLIVLFVLFVDSKQIGFNLFFFMSVTGPTESSLWTSAPIAKKNAGR